MEGLVEHLAAEEVYKYAQAAKEDRQPQVEVLKDCGEHTPVCVEVNQRLASLALQNAGFKLKGPAVLTVEVLHPCA